MRDRRRLRTVSDRNGCPVRERISSLMTNSDQRMFRIRLRHQLSSASIVLDKTTVTDHVSAQYKNIGRMHVLQRRSLVSSVMLDRHIFWSTENIASRTMLARRLISGSLLPEQWIRQPRYVNDSTTSTWLARTVACCVKTDGQTYTSLSQRLRYAQHRAGNYIGKEFDPNMSQFNKSLITML